jgi:hypothetical protein
MKRLRFLVATIIFWLFLLYNIERLSQPINISRVSYILTAIVAALTVLIPRLHRAPLWLILGGPVALFLAIKAWLGVYLWGEAIPLTVTEMSFISLTSLLARQLSHVLSEFDKAVADITIEVIGKATEPFTAGQGEMYRELRRARTYHRPLSLMAVGIEEGSLQDILPRIVAEAQHAMNKHLALSGIAKVLDEKLEDHHIIAKQNSHFIVLLPETERKDMAALERQLRDTAAEQTGVTLKIGTSSLSDDVITFEKLVEEAMVAMETEQKPSPSPGSLSVKHRTFLT